jgi:HAMP domain-containing protein
MFQSATRDASPPLRARSSLGRKLALVLLPLMLIPLAAMGATVFYRTRGILRDQAANQLISATESQISSLEDWSQVRQQRLQLGAQRSSLRDEVALLLYDTPTGAEFEDLKTSTRADLEDLKSNEGQTLFSEILVARPDGTIVTSTNESWEGQTLSALSEGMLTADQPGTHPLYNDQVLDPGKLALVSLSPLRSGHMTEVDAALVGVNLDTRVGTLMQQLQVFWQQRGVYRQEIGSSYLAIPPSTVFRLTLYALAPEAVEGVQMPIFDVSQTDTPATVEYTNFDGTPVLSAYQWVPGWNMAVVTEVPQETVFADLNSLLPFTVTTVVLAAALSLIVIVVATSRLLRPLGRLAEFAQRISKGDWAYRVPEDRNDEIGLVSGSLNRMAEELSQIYTTLETRVKSRTQQIQTAAQVARAVTSIPTLEDLLRQAVNLIREQFDYYYVSIFLIDRDGTDAVLAEATGEVGQALIARGHRLAIGSQSIIGWVTANNQPRIASEVGDDPVHFRNELLPETRAELAVPLQVGGTVLGALDVQSTSPDAFKPEDLEILQTLADQLSAAIQNARLAQVSMEAAERSRLISEVTGQLSGLLDVDQVLSTAAQSLHRALDQPEILIQLSGTEGPDGQEPYFGPPGSGR